MFKLKKVILVLFGWRVALFTVGTMASLFLIYEPSFPYADSLLGQFKLPQWLYSWANFDGVHYLTISSKGYFGTGLIQAFFPLYPGLVKIVSVAISNQLLSGLLVSNLALFGAFIALYKLTVEEYSHPIAYKTVALLLLFPTAFFFGALYSESLFLLLIVAFFLCLKRKQWMLAGIFAGLASATRIVGIALLPAFVYISWQEYSVTTSLRHFLQKKWQIIFGLLLSVSGLASYMTYLWYRFNDSLYFLHVQSEFGAGRSESIVLYPQVLWRSLKILVTVNPTSWQYWTFSQEFAVGLGAALILLLSFKQLKKEYWIFALCAFLIPTLTGTFSSLPRYVLVCFPLFWWLAVQWSKERSKYYFLYLVISGMILIINTMLFIQGYWVA